MAQEATRAITDVGRIIWGSVSDRATKDYDGKDYPTGEGPIQFGLAVRKDAPNIGDFLGKAYQTAQAGYQNNPGIRQRIDQEWQSGFPGGFFRFKIKDGDRPGSKSGKVDPNAAGHWVLAMSTTIPIKCGNAQNQEIDPKMIKRGYFVDVAVSMKVNEQTDHTAGIYMNPNVVRLIAYGEEIVGGISIDDAFKGHAAPSQLPPGASQTPIAPAGGMPGLPPAGQPQGGQMPGFTQGGGLPNIPPNGAPANVPGYAPNAAGQPGQPAPTGYPPAGQPGYAPTLPGSTAYPSNPPQGGQPGGPGQMPAGFQPGGFQPPMNSPSPTGYPIDPQTGQPVNPNYGFARGPGQ